MGILVLGLVVVAVLLLASGDPRHGDGTAYYIGGALLPLRPLGHG